MEMPKDYNETQGITGDYEIVEAGGYICKIVSAKEEKSQAGNSMLVLALDIAEGEHQGYYKKLYDERLKQNKNPNAIIKYPNNAIHRIMLYDKDGKCNKFFKGFGTIIEESNVGYKWTGDEKTLTNKVLGVIFGEEEYEKMDGSIGTSTKVKSIRTVKAIHEGNYKVPELKKLPPKGEAFEDFVNSATSNEELPF